MGTHININAVEMPFERITTSINADITNHKNPWLDVIDNLFYELSNSMFSTIKYHINGRVRHGKPLIFSRDERTKTHENAHIEIRKVWKKIGQMPYIQFNESFAYSITDKIENTQEMINDRVKLANEIPLFWESITKQKRKGQTLETTKNQQKIEELVNLSMLATNENNWAAFLKLAHNFQFYHLMDAVFTQYGIKKGKELVFDSVKQMKTKKTLKNGVKYLKRNLDIRSQPIRIAYINSECEEMKSGSNVVLLENEHTNETINIRTVSKTAKEIILHGIAKSFPKGKGFKSGMNKGYLSEELVEVMGIKDELEMLKETANIPKSYQNL